MFGIKKPRTNIALPGYFASTPPPPPLKYIKIWIDKKPRRQKQWHKEKQKQIDMQ